MMPGRQYFRYVLVGLSIIILVCAVKNYVAFFVRDTFLCHYLCPSAFGLEFLQEAAGFKQLFLAQQWLLSLHQETANRLFVDRWNLVACLITAPVIEEFIYRGPMYLTRAWASRKSWWLCGLLLVCAFALSHGRSGVALLPTLALGAYNLWLVAKTGALWPAITLHFLYNFFFMSVLLYQSIWISD